MVHVIDGEFLLTRESFKVAESIRMHGSML